ncbi:hypothetical protein NDU88_002591 [Pleurodeles waltl]|uniref:Uncharacterized protein n=1 Tax=Pleurodeles waltl TaxID=8319 RepID=A0AAV7MT90_PLEWA|nr:hypothetical protein NDU88_002591 [Pleurodeles waltl]
MHAKLTEFQDTALAEVQHLGKYAMARVYGEGERPGSALVNVIRPNKESSLIIAIQADDGGEIREPELIACIFRDCYESLYISRVALDSEELLNYIVHNELPRLVFPEQSSATLLFCISASDLVLECMALMCF